MSLVFWELLVSSEPPGRRPSLAGRAVLLRGTLGRHTLPYLCWGAAEEALHRSACPCASQTCLPASGR